MNKKENFSKLAWETLEQSSEGLYYSRVRRAAVLGGWLVESARSHSHITSDGEGAGIGYGVGLTFVPDPEHTWKID